MNLSAALVSEFVKVTKNETQTDKETTVYGTAIVSENGDVHVRLDGADSSQYTPAVPTTAVKNGDRVTVLIKNHTATITGNITSPAARSDDLDDTNNRITEAEYLIADCVSTEELTAQIARIDTLETDYLVVKEQLQAESAIIEELQATDVDILGKLTAAEADIDDLSANKLDAEVADITYATIENLEAAQATIYNLEATYGEFVELTTEKFTAVEADIDDLQTNKLSATDAALVYANIDFANIGEAAIENFYAKSGLIDDLVISDGMVTGTLVGVTIKGDLIEGGTIVADKLVVKGEDGLYYRLNMDGATVEAEQTDYNSLNGSVIAAKSITATKINVDDLVAFDATIGGFNITADALYSGVKESIDNSTRGIYLDNEGQLYIGDADNFIRYYKDLDDEGNEIYRLAISAESILFGADSKSSAADLKSLTEHVKISTYEDPDTGELEPCVELAEGDSDFKQVITNTKTMFMDGSTVRTEINANGVETDNITVKNELRHGSWVWAVRSNGNYGLSWKGESS